MIEVPEYAKKAIKVLKDSGYEAYCVGGCVRDSLLNKTPNDWDICTSASPSEMTEVFAGYRVVETGLKHGTLTVIIDRNPLEITSYRTEGSYIGHRRPEGVKFIKDLNVDISRRDFTVNALCCDENGEITDKVSGIEDLEKKIIRCVGDPYKRFEEDALRIIRALRFASVLGFTIDKYTSDAIFEKKNLLGYISGERIFSELKKLICGKAAAKILLEYRDVFGVIMPEIIPCFDFKQNNKHHCYDVWTHICKSVASCRDDDIIRLTMLFHDIGKPYVAKTDENGIIHFPGHQEKSVELLTEILNCFHASNATVELIKKLVLEHDNRIPVNKRAVKMFMAQYGFEFYINYLEVRLADINAQSEYMQKEKHAELDELTLLGIQINNENCCLNLCDLAVNGKDMILLGITGQKIGITLQRLLALVIDDKLENDHDTLVNYVRKVLK